MDGCTEGNSERYSDEDLLMVSSADWSVECICICCERWARNRDDERGIVNVGRGEADG
jgi:hypothetical protein